MQMSMSVSESGIKSDFLNAGNYKTTLEFASKRNDEYLRYCKVIQKYYCDLLGMTKVMGDRIKTNNGAVLKTVGQFRLFLVNFMRIIEEVSKFKIQYYEDLQEIEEDPVKKPTYQILAKASQYESVQSNYKILYEKLQKTQKQIEQTSILLKKETKHAVNYFDIKNTHLRCTSIEDLVKTRQALAEEGNIMLETIYKNSEDFQKDIMFYRQKMLCGKYKVHQKLHEMSHGTKECMVETLLSLVSLVDQQQNIFHHMQRASVRESTLLQQFQRKPQVATLSDQLNLTDTILHATREYQMIIDQFLELLKVLSQCLLMVGTSLPENHQNGKVVVQELNKLYQNQSNPTPQIIQTLDMFYFFCQKLAQIPTSIHILEVNLGKLRQNISKHSEITLSLVKCGSINQVKSEGKGGMDEIGHLFDQLSFDFINDILIKLYKVFESSLGNIKNHFNAKFYKKRKHSIQDSMQISHYEEDTPMVQKRPSKKEMWIWRDFRNCGKYNRISDGGEKLKEILKEVKIFKEIKIQGGKEIEKYNCDVKSRNNLKGILTIFQKNLTFAATMGPTIVIPYDFIQEVVAEVNIFQRELVVKTSMGNIGFIKFPQISRAQVLLQQQIQAYSSSTQIIQKKSIQISKQQGDFIASRRQTIQKDRHPIQQMKQMATVLLQNQTIDAVYDTIYSDKPFKFKGKEECCFMSYVLKKGGGSNYRTTPYNPPGPKFYSLQEGRTFENTPLFSERTNYYDVELPPIPFMPKKGQSTEQVKIYWLSNQELDYVFRCDSKAPMGDTFFLTIVHRVATKGKDVEIKVYFSYTFVKNTSMKGMIASKSEEEAAKGINSFVNEARKVMKSGGSGGGEGPAEVGKDGAMTKADDEDQRGNTSMQKGRVKKLQNQNKILIGILVGVIVLNLVLKFI